MAITNKNKRIRISRDMVGRFSEDGWARSRIRIWLWYAERNGKEWFMYWNRLTNRLDSQANYDAVVSGRDG